MSDTKENNPEMPRKVTSKGFTFKRKAKPEQSSTESEKFAFDEVENLIDPSSKGSPANESGPAFPVVPIDQNAKSLTEVLKAHRDVATKRFSGSESYIADAVSRLCDSVLESVAEKGSAASTGENSKNVELRKQKKRLIETVDRMEQELRSWADVENASDVTKNPILQAVAVEDTKSAAATPSKESLHKTLELASEINEGLSKIERNIDFQSQCIENKLLTVQHVVDKAQQTKARLVSNISEKTFKGYENKGDARQIIKKFVSVSGSDSR